MSRKQKFWEKHSHCKDTLSVIASIVTILGIIYIGREVYIRTIPELGFCPYLSSGGLCGWSENYNFCGSDEVMNVECRNFGDLWIEAEIYNRGLVLAIDTELEVRLYGAEFGLDDSDRTVSFVNRYLDGVKVGGDKPVKRNDFLLTQNIHTLEPNERRRAVFEFPETFGIYKRPTQIEFILKENGIEIDKKTIYLESKNRICNKQPLLTPYPISGIVTIDGISAESVDVIIKNLQTNDELNFSTNKFGEYIMDMSNFKNGWETGDIIEIKTCMNSSCKIHNYIKLGSGEGSITFPITR